MRFVKLSDHITFIAYNKKYFTLHQPNRYSSGNDYRPIFPQWWKMTHVRVTLKLQWALNRHSSSVVLKIPRHASHAGQDMAWATKAELFKHTDPEKKLRLRPTHRRNTGQLQSNILLLLIIIIIISSSSITVHVYNHYQNHS